jgi:predicted HTH transcriptional regulator
MPYLPFKLDILCKYPRSPYLCITVEQAALKRLVRQGEGQRLEFKRKARHPEKIAREVVAFANTDGGTLLIGVDDDHRIYGCKYPGEDAYALTTFFKQHIVPSLPYSLSHIPINGQREVLVFEIEASHRKPHFLKLHEGPGGKSAFVRVADMSIKASREMLQVLRLSKRERGVKIRFGDRERQLLQYFEEASNITLDQAQKLLKTSRRKTSDLLVTLVRANILSIHPSVKGDSFRLQESSFRL